MDENRIRIIENITDTLEEGVRNVFDGPQYRNYLRVMSRFHRYSVNNTLLIFMQCPEATRVAGFHAWQNDFGRHVIRGEKGIRILAPVREKVISVKENEPQLSKEEMRITGYRPVTVFDISQTEGKPLPQSPVQLLDGGLPDPLFIEALLLASPVPVRFRELSGGINGCYRPVEKDIAIRSGLPPAQTAKTMLHEIAHAILHADNASSSRLDRMKREIEAESVAYAVSSYYGIDTSKYSFGYIASWSKDKDVSMLRQSLHAIRVAADRLITTIELIRNPAQSAEKKPACAGWGVQSS